MKARFPSKCEECGAPIKTGNEIEKNSADKWVHKACCDTQEEIP